LTVKASLEAGGAAPVVGGHEQRFFPTRGPLEALKPGGACSVVRPAWRQHAWASPPLASSSYTIRFEYARPAPATGPITVATEVFMLTTGKCINDQRRYFPESSGRP
jgi:hypothetical protein